MTSFEWEEIAPSWSSQNYNDQPSGAVIPYEDRIYVFNSSFNLGKTLRYYDQTLESWVVVDETPWRTLLEVTNPNFFIASDPMLTWAVEGPDLTILYNRPNLTGGSDGAALLTFNFETNTCGGSTIDPSPVQAANTSPQASPQKVSYVSGQDPRPFLGRIRYPQGHEGYPMSHSWGLYEGDLESGEVSLLRSYPDEIPTSLGRAEIWNINGTYWGMYGSSVFDLSSGLSWELTSPPRGLGDHFVYGDKFYVFAGADVTGSYPVPLLRSISIFDTVLKAWTTVDSPWGTSQPWAQTSALGLVDEVLYIHTSTEYSGPTNGYTARPGKLYRVDWGWPVELGSATAMGRSGLWEGRYLAGMAIGESTAVASASIEVKRFYTGGGIPIRGDRLVEYWEEQ